MNPQAKPADQGSPATEKKTTVKPPEELAVKKTAVTDPALGTWSLTANVGGKAHQMTFVFARRNGTLTEGFLEWNPTGRPKIVEIVSCRYDPKSDILRICGREMHLELPNNFPPALTPGIFEAKLSDDGKKLSDVRNLRNPASLPATARWLNSAVTPPSMPSVMTAVNLSGERARLYQQLSGDYALGDTKFVHASDNITLADLERTDDKHVRTLVEARVTLRKLVEEAITDNRKNAERARNMQLKLLEAVAKSLNDEANVPDNFRRMFNSDPLQGIFDAQKHTLYVACFQEAIIALNRNEVRASFQAKGINKQLNPKSLAVSFRVNQSGVGIMIIQNKSGIDLHNCFVATHMKVDQKKVEAYERDARPGNESAYALAKLMGLKTNALAGTQEAINAYFRIDKGANVFVPEWKRDSVIEVDIATAQTIALVAASIEAWLGCDEGTASRDLDLESVKRANPVVLSPRMKLAHSNNAIDNVISVAISPDGNTLASGGFQDAQLWDIKTGKAKALLKGHTSDVRVAFSPDGKILASAGTGRVILFDAQTGEEKGRFTRLEFFFNSLAFSPDGKMLAAGHIVLDRAGRILAQFGNFPGQVNSLAFSPDGKTLAVGGGEPNGGVIILLDTKTWMLRAMLKGHKGDVRTLAYSPDGKTLASGSADPATMGNKFLRGPSEIKFWDAQSGMEQATLTGHNWVVFSLAFSPDGKTLAAGSWNPGSSDVTLWDVESRKPRTKFQETNGSTSECVVFCPDGKTLVVAAGKRLLGGKNETILFLDVPAAK